MYDLLTTSKAVCGDNNSITFGYLVFFIDLRMNELIQVTESKGGLSDGDGPCNSHGSL
jgi:hypothetical protein